MITWHSSIPPWHRPCANLNQMGDTYWEIVRNVAASCGEEDILLLDNTYLDREQTKSAIGKHKKIIILSLVDPPYTWHYLEEHLADTEMEIMCIGTDAPDLKTFFCLAALHQKWPSYAEDELDFKPEGQAQIFLCYNFQPHDHRRRLRSVLYQRGLLDRGIFTLRETNRAINPDGREMNLGNMRVWQSHFLNIVSETVFNLYDSLIVSEKTLKALLGLRPFVINGSPRYYEVLESLGIDTFRDVFPVDRLSAPANDIDFCMSRNHAIIAEVVEDLCQKDLKHLYQTLRPRLLENRKIITEKMAEEYQRLCIDPIPITWRRPGEPSRVSA